MSCELRGAGKPGPQVQQTNCSNRRGFGRQELPMDVVRNELGPCVMNYVSEWATFYFNPCFFCSPRRFFPPSTFLFHPLNLFLSPSNLSFSSSTLSPRPNLFHPPSFAWCVDWLASLLSCKPNIDSLWGKHGIVWSWLIGLLVARRATNARQVSTTFLGKTPFGCYFFFIYYFPWLVCWLVRPAGLVGRLDSENTHTVMDGSWTGTKM